MRIEALHRRVQGELERLLELGLLTPAARIAIGGRYEPGPVDLGLLARWFTILGAVAMAAGVVLLVHLHAGKWLAIQGGLAVLGLLLLGGGWFLKHRRDLIRTGAALELLGGLACQGLLAALAVHYSTGSRNWPALVGLQCLLALGLAYGLGNRLLLVLAGIQAFVWFGGETGYLSGWGCWWLGMTYPARFLVAGLAFLGVAWLHARWLRQPWAGFARVYAHLGLLDLHFAFWFLSVFGWYTDTSRFLGTQGQRLGFSAAWAALSLLGVLLAGRTGLRMLRSYGLTFLLINLYTFYFQFVVWHSAGAWFLHLLLMGAGLVGGGMFLERQLKVKD